MIKLGITGGIACGKSTATEYLKNKKHTIIFNADRESKKHLKSSSSIQKKLINVFGKSILINKKIQLDLLAEIAFSNSTNHKILNGIMWPEISVLIDQAYNQAKNNDYKLFIVDAALIFEANFTSFFDKTILISTNKPNRISRAVNRRNLSLEDIQNRIFLQMPEKDKKKIADIIIYNNGSINNLYSKLDKLYVDLLK
tara:strand:- start:1762 stop:2355 length:594 start_codon:yes stop_codon:yes gene_type:complete